MGVLSALLFGMVPAWRAAQVDALALHRRRSSSPRRWSRTGAPMVAAQVAIAVAIAFGALVAARTFIGVLRTPLGFSPDRVAIVNVALPKETDLQAYYERVIRALRDTPDVMAAGAVAMLPFSRDAANDLGQSSTSRSRVGIVHTLPGYFEAAGISLRRGRLLRWDDARSDPDAAVISELAAAALFPGGEAIGAEFENSHGRRFHVIGVVADVRNSLSKPSEPLTYVIPDADLRSGLYVVARLRDNRARTLESLVTGLRDVTPQPPIANWWSDQIATQLEIRDPRFQLIVLGGLAAIALGLTALGVFGIVGYTVSARTREMGVRLALGASPAGLAALVIRQWLSPVVFGVALGFGLIMLGRGLAEAQFYRVNVHDPLAMTAAMAVVVVSALLAAFLPARRAAAIDPVEVLKAD
jgi:putative ABC transport system permease protein